MAFLTTIGKLMKKEFHDSFLPKNKLLVEDFHAFGLAFSDK